MGLLVRNGEIVTADSRTIADIWCEGESITQIGRNLAAPAGAEVIDATGKLVFPGFIDPHVHIYLPFMGSFAKDDYETASVAALCGGTTTVMDLAIPGPKDRFQDALDTWMGKAEGKACCDYTFHFGVTRFDGDSDAALREILRRGVTTFKVFLGYKGAFGLSDEALWKELTLAREVGALTTAHCENAEIITQMQAKLFAEGKTGPQWHEPSRPVEVEALGTRVLMTFARLTGAPVYVVHVSCKEALKEVERARKAGADVTAETLINYLVLDNTYACRPDFEGAKYVMSPPIRERSNQPVLWEGLRDGRIATVGTDHCPFDTTQKRMGIHDFRAIPNGVPAIEDRVRMLYTHGVVGGRLDVHRFVEVAATNAAKTFGLFPKKGTIQVGSDADLVVYDPSVKETLSARTHHMNVDYNAFEGWEVAGRCAAVTVRGQVQVRDGQFVGRKGFGRFLPRQPREPRE